MEFDLDLFDKISITQVNQETGRHYEVANDKNKYTSVTSFLGKTELDKNGLDEWRYNVGEEEAYKISSEALLRGTTIHAMFENYILNGEEENTEKYRLQFSAIKALLDKYLSKVKGVEHQMYSKRLMLAGTADLIGVWDNKLSIIDFKGSGKPKSIGFIEGYVLQCLIYALMVEELYDEKVEQLVILVAIDGYDKAQRFIISRKDWKPYLKILQQKLKRFKDLYAKN